MIKSMKCLTIRQPWANAIFFEGKDIENRNWVTNFRGTVAIHSAKIDDLDDYLKLVNKKGISISNNEIENNLNCLPKGYILGTVEIIDCVCSHSSLWFEGPVGFVLKNPRIIKPIPYRGLQKLYDLDEQTTSKILHAL